MVRANKHTQKATLPSPGNNRVTKKQNSLSDQSRQPVISEQNDAYASIQTQSAHSGIHCQNQPTLQHEETSGTLS